MEIPKVYNPKDTEKWYNFWLEKGYFFSHSEPEGRKPFTIVIPPPNITGSLHMGHALNNTLQDVIIRFRRMRGDNACWVPGTDHGGIATQNVVEKILLKEGLTRQELGREKFLERMWQWRKETGDTILHQLEKLGCSCDWERLRFTMDETCSRAVLDAFVELYNRGLIYRGSRLVNWCVRCGTALADIEVEYREHKGHLWYIKYPLKTNSKFPPPRICLGHDKIPNSKFIVVATTRPETMLGDTAVAVNPEDKRYKNLIGKIAILPLMNREISIIADEAVDSSFGTGAVKVTPAHDPLDFELAQRHKLEEVTVIDKEGKMTTVTGKYSGLDRYHCREQVVKDLQTLGLLEKVEDYTHRIGHCYRCRTVIEPLISEQWFLSTKEMARKARKVVEEGKIKFFPERWIGPYLQWLENLRDWCISRQIWWGHRIPVYYCRKTENSEQLTVNSKKKSCPPIVSVEKPEKCPNCGSTNLVQDSDVLDTWFSSALWPFSVFGWQANYKPKTTNHELSYYYPTTVLVTGYEILYLWVARMVMMGLELVGDIPFENVYIHGIVRDISGRKMSKSLGNVIDPLDIMKSCGTDALRFALLSGGVTGQDLCLSEENFLMARNFANKIWNASRFVLMNLEGFTYQPINRSTCQLDLSDRWIISEYHSLVKAVTENLENYQLSEATRDIYEFFWHKFCDWYLELTKIHLNPKFPIPNSKVRTTQTILVSILEGTLKLLHPFMPFITEEIWQSLMQFRVQSSKFREGNEKLSTLPGQAGNSQLSTSIMVSPWPEYDEKMIDRKATEEMKILIEIISAIRNLRSETKIPPPEKISLIFKVSSAEKAKLIQDNLSSILLLTNGEKLEFGVPKSKNCVLTIVNEIEIYIPLTAIDREKEIKRLGKEIEILSQQTEKLNQKLSNQNFLKKAPEEEIKKIKEKLKETEERKNKLEQILLHLKR